MADVDVSEKILHDATVDAVKSLLTQGAEYVAVEQSLRDYFARVYGISWMFAPYGTWIAQQRGFSIGTYWTTFHEMLIDLLSLISKAPGEVNYDALKKSEPIDG